MNNEINAESVADDQGRPCCPNCRQRAITEDDLRATIKANPWFGDWDEWAEEAYNCVPVFARMAMAHIYGRHDDTEIPYAYCVLCHAFRVQHNDGLGCAE